MLAHLVAHGSDLLACEGLLGLEAVLARLEQGETGAESEIRIIAFFRRAGLVVVLEPQLDGRTPDFAVEVDRERTYFEVIGRSWPDAMMELSRQVESAADALFSAVAVGHRLQVAFLAEPDAADAVPGLAVSPEVRRVDDTALVRLTLFRDETEGISLDERPSIGAVRFNLVAGDGTGVDVKAAFSDERGRRLLEAELHHFPRDTPNAVTVDVSAIPDGFRLWPSLVERAFQPTLNTRIGAVVLCALRFNGVVTPGVLRGVVLPNPHARVPIRPDLINLVSDALLAP